MATIQSVKARQIFDSRGNPTVEVDVILSNGDLARAVVPSGASTALELRDGSSEYRGKGVSKAVNKVNSIIGPALVGKDPSDQTAIDAFMVQQLDGTQNEWGWCKQKHIANITGNKKLVLPIPAFNVINGGSHAGNKLAMQQFMILPVGASSFKESMKMGCEVYHHLKADVDGNRLLDYGEFVAVIIHLQRMENDEHFHRAFLFFDKDGNGYIDLDELREALALITLYDSYSINKEKVFHFNSCNVIFCLRN